MRCTSISCIWTIPSEVSSDIGDGTVDGEGKPTGAKDGLDSVMAGAACKCVFAPWYTLLVVKTNARGLGARLSHDLSLIHISEPTRPY